MSKTHTLEVPLATLQERLDRVRDDSHPDEWISPAGKISVARRKLFAAGYAATSNVAASSRVAGFRTPQYRLLEDPYVAALVRQEMQARLVRTRVTGDQILCDVLEGLDVAMARRDTFVTENHPLLGMGSVALRKHDLAAAAKFLDQLGKYKKLWADADKDRRTAPALVLNLGGAPVLEVVPDLERVDVEDEGAFAVALGPPDTDDPPVDDDQGQWEDEDADDPWEEDDDDWLR